MARPQGKTRAQTSLSLPDLAFFQDEKSQILEKCQNGGKCDLNAEFEERRKESIKRWECRQTRGKQSFEIA